MVVGSGAVDRSKGLGDGADVRGEALAARQARLGGARADFVAGLGTRLGELGASLRAWQAEPWSPAAREELAKRLHALSAGARLLRFTCLADELVTCERVLDGLAADAPLDAETVHLVRGSIARAPALAWGETSLLEPARGAPAAANAPRPLGDGTLADLLASGPLTALVVGPSTVADALLELGAGDATFEVERTDEAAGALGLARAFAPDVVVVDTDLPGAGELIGALACDALTEAVPVVAIGSWVKSEEAAPYVALGVAKALARPVSPDVLRVACAEASATYLRREIVREPIGALTVDQLGARLAEELRRGLCDAADARGRAVSVDLGEGDDVLAALWGAVARIRDLVTIRSRGAVHFAPSGPEGALPVAPWLGDGAAPGGAGLARATSADRSQAAPGLEGMTAIVADDDPAVTWFLAGALRAAGARVHEARDGVQALDLAFRHAPDLVVSDVLMPGLDGFAVCRSLKRDVVLRDVPVILLSWKEDLLQRVRELGADADGYLLKEATASLIVQRVREVMRPRYRVAQRLAGAGEVRGRVDGLTTRTLLAFTCAHRPFSTLAVRDASFLYEIEIRNGRPARATRTAAGGAFERGPMVLAALLGVGAGRFVVSPLASEAPGRVRPELAGSLGEQLLPHVAAARAAQRLLSGSALLAVERVGLSSDRIAAYLGATPEPARGLLRALAEGESPRALLLAGQVSARLLEDVLCDAAAHGVVASIFDTSGVNLLPAALQREEAVLLGQRISAPPPALPEPEGLLPLTPFAGAVVERARDDESGPIPAAVAELEDPLPAPPAPEEAPLLRLLPLAEQLAALDPEPEPSQRVTVVVREPAPAREPASAVVAPAPVVAEVVDAPIRSAATEVVDAPIEAPAAREPSAVATGAISTPESSPSSPVAALLAGDEASTRVPEGIEPIYLPLATSPATPTPSAMTPAPAAPAEPPARATLGPVLTLSFTPPPAAPQPEPPRAVEAVETPAPASAKKVEASKPAPPPEPSVPLPPRRRDDGRRTRDEAVDETPSARRFPRPSAYAPDTAARAPERKDPRDVRFTWWVAFAAVGVVFAVGARWSREHGMFGGAPAAPPPIAAPAQLAAPPPVQAGTGAPAQVAPTPAATASAAAEAEEPVTVQDLPLKAGDKLPAGQGRLEIVAGSSDMIYVDGQMVGKGPVVKLVLAPKSGAKPEYEVRVKLRGEERVRYVAVKEGRLARVRVAPPWSR
jgi:CheY-like chemotaxis protein